MELDGQKGPSRRRHRRSSGGARGGQVERRPSVQSPRRPFFDLKKRDTLTAIGCGLLLGAAFCSIMLTVTGTSTLLGYQGHITSIPIYFKKGKLSVLIFVLLYSIYFHVFLKRTRVLVKEKVVELDQLKSCDISYDKWIQMDDSVKSFWFPLLCSVVMTSLLLTYSIYALIYIYADMQKNGFSMLGFNTHMTYLCAGTTPESQPAAMSQGAVSLSLHDCQTICFYFFLEHLITAILAVVAVLILPLLTLHRLRSNYLAACGGTHFIQQRRVLKDPQQPPLKSEKKSVYSLDTFDATYPLKHSLRDIPLPEIDPYYGSPEQASLLSAVLLGVTALSGYLLVQGFYAYHGATWYAGYLTADMRYFSHRALQWSRLVLVALLALLYLALLSLSLLANHRGTSRDTGCATESPLRSTLLFLTVLGVLAAAFHLALVVLFFLMISRSDNSISSSSSSSALTNATTGMLAGLVGDYTPMVFYVLRDTLPSPTECPHVTRFSCFWDATQGQDVVFPDTPGFAALLRSIPARVTFFFYRLSLQVVAMSDDTAPYVTFCWHYAAVFVLGESLSFVVLLYFVLWMLGLLQSPSVTAASHSDSEHSAGKGKKHRGFDNSDEDESQVNEDN